MFVLSDRTKMLLEQQARSTFSEILEMSLDDEIHHVCKINGKGAVFSKKKRRNIFSRGNPLIAQKRLRTMEDVDKGIEQLLEGGWQKE